MGNNLKNKLLKWQEPSTQLERLLDPSSQERTSPPPRPPRENPQLNQEVSRDPTDSDQEPLLSETSESSRNPLNSSLENFHSRDSSEKSPTISRTTSDSSHLPSLLSKKPLRPTWLVFSRTPTSAPSTPRESPSCQRTCSSPEESEVRDPELRSFYECRCYIRITSNLKNSKNQ